MSRGERITCPRMLEIGNFSFPLKLIQVYRFVIFGWSSQAEPHSCIDFRNDHLDSTPVTSKGLSRAMASTSFKDRNLIAVIGDEVSSLYTYLLHPVLIIR